MTELNFMIRHTPFWAVPLFVIAAEFAYIFWLRKKKRSMKTCFVFMLFALLAVAFYYWAGGPEKAVRKFMKIQKENL